MYDFGVFGKWSESTLNIQKRDYNGYITSYNRVSIIESDYRKRENEISERMSRLGKQKIKNLTLGDIYTNVMLYIKLSKRMDTLRKDYKKYTQIMGSEKFK